MTRRELIDYCLTFPDAYEDYPFDEEWTLMRHRTNKKSFAFIYQRNGELCVNLKCEPIKADFLRSVYEGVRPAYHMNKTHWITLVINSDVPEPDIAAMITESHACTRMRRKKFESV